MKKLIPVLLSCVLLLSMFAGIASAATFELTSDTSVQQEEIKAYMDMLAMFTATPVDLTAIKAAYEEKMQAKVIAVNADIDANVIFTLQAAIDGDLSEGQA